MAELLHTLYENLMKHQPYGKALYHPLSTDHFKPLSCGYFDEFGQWNAIVQLDDVEALKKETYQPCGEEPQRAPLEADIEWGPKGSFRIQGTKLDLSANAHPPGIPADVAAVFQYSDSSNSGAILMTKPFVYRNAVYHEAPYVNWVKENTATLLAKRPEIKSHGMYIVTSTYSTQLCSLNVWNSIDKKISLGFKAGAVNIGEIGPHGQWFEASSDGGWVRYESKEKDVRKVVFFGGLRFKYTRVWGQPTILKTSSRSGKDERDQIIPIAYVTMPEDEMYLVECENLIEDAGNDNEGGDEVDEF